MKNPPDVAVPVIFVVVKNCMELLMEIKQSLPLLALTQHQNNASDPPKLVR